MYKFHVICSNIRLNVGYNLNKKRPLGEPSVEEGLVMRHNSMNPIGPFLKIMVWFIIHNLEITFLDHHNCVIFKLNGENILQLVICQEYVGTYLFSRLTVLYSLISYLKLCFMF